MFFQRIKSKYVLGYTIITMSMLDLFLFLYYLNNDINGYAILFQLWLSNYIISAGGEGVNMPNVVLLGSLSLLVSGLGFGGWYYWKRILPIAGAISISKVSTVLDDSILESSWQCGHCNLRFKIGEWGKTVIYGGVLAGTVIYTCPNCKRPIKSDKVPQGEKEPVEIIDLEPLQDLLEKRESEPKSEEQDDFNEATPETKDEAVDLIMGRKTEEKKPEPKYESCPECGNSYLERGMKRHLASHKKKSIKKVETTSDL